MANRRLDPVTYRPFRAENVLSEGLLAVARDGGDLERRVAQGMARIAADYSDKADREAELAGMKAGRRDAMAQAPGIATVAGGETIGTVSGSAEAGNGIRVAVPSTAIGKMIQEAAARHGVDPVALSETARIESGFDPNARNPNSSAGGILQFIDSTARAYGLADKFNPAQAIEAGARLMRDNAAGLMRALGRAATPGELYLAHQQGLGGASKLLANPQALAADLVGEEAVRLNGGQPGMTAGEFAALWTGKVKAGAPAPASANGNASPDGTGSYTPIPASSVAPMSVTPIVTPLSVTPGKAGGFRPSGRDTVYGRAYDVQGTRTYLEELDLTMRADQAAVYEAYKADPVMLEKALGELETAHMRESVFEEIAPEYSVAFRRQAMTLVDRAKAERETVLKEQNKADFLTRMGDYETRKAQALAGFDPEKPESAAALMDLQGSIDAHYDSAVARGILTPAQALVAKDASRSETTVSFYLKQTAGRSPEEIAAVRAEMSADFAEGRLEGVSGDDWAKINSGLAEAEKARRTQDTQANRMLDVRGRDLAKRVAQGLPVTAEEMARFQLDAGTAPKGAEIVQSTLARMRVSDAIRKMPIDQVERSLPELLKGEGGTVRPDDMDFARKTIDSHRKALADDPIGVAERFGVIAPSEPLPLEAGIGLDQAESAFAARMASADAVAEHFGVSPRFFRPEEKGRIKTLIDEDPDAALALAAGVVSAAGPRARAVLKELGDVAPAMEQAGTVLTIGGNADAARDLMAGYGKTPEGGKYPDYGPDKRRPIAEKVVGSALVFDPALARSFDAGAASIARKRLYDAGIDPKSDEAKPIFRQALNEAAGAHYVNGTQFGGFASYDPGFTWSPRQVVVPVNIRADSFGDVVGAMTDADLAGMTAKNGRAWRAADFQKAYPVRVNGGHVFAQGDPTSATPLFITDAKGNPIVLDFEGELGKTLASRLPEAFR